MDAFKLCRTRGGSPRGTRARHTGRSVVPGRDAGRPEEQAHLSLGQKRLTSPGHPRWTHPINLSIRCGMPRTWDRSRPPAPRRPHDRSLRTPELHRPPQPNSAKKNRRRRPAAAAPPRRLERVGLLAQRPSRARMGDGSGEREMTMRVTITLGVAPKSLGHLARALAQFEDFCTASQSVELASPLPLRSKVRTAACSNSSKHVALLHTPVSCTTYNSTILDDDHFAFGKRPPPFARQRNVCKQCDCLAFAAGLDCHTRSRQSIDICNAVFDRGC